MEIEPLRKQEQASRGSSGSREAEGSNEVKQILLLTATTFATTGLVFLGSWAAKTRGPAEGLATAAVLSMGAVYWIGRVSGIVFEKENHEDASRDSELKGSRGWSS